MFGKEGRQNSKEKNIIKLKLQMVIESSLILVIPECGCFSETEPHKEEQNIRILHLTYITIG